MRRRLQPVPDLLGIADVAPRGLRGPRLGALGPRRLGSLMSLGRLSSELKVLKVKVTLGTKPRAPDRVYHLPG